MKLPRAIRTEGLQKEKMNERGKDVKFGREKAEVFTEGNKTFKRDSGGLAHRLNFHFGPLPGCPFFSFKTRIRLDNLGFK